MIKIISAIANESEELKEQDYRYLSSHLNGTIDVDIESLTYGFPTIESEVQATVNASQVIMRYMEGFEEECSGVVIDCFDDPGVLACRELPGPPVIGTGHTAFHTAAALSDRIGVITTDEMAKTGIWRKARTLGIESRLKAVEDLGLSVEELLTNEELLFHTAVSLCEKMEKEHGIGAVILGCTCMNYMYDRIRSTLQSGNSMVNVIEPMLNAVIAMDGMIRLGYQTRMPAAIDFEKLSWIQREK